MVTVNHVQFGYVPERGKFDAVFILGRLQEGYHAKGKRLYMCKFVICMKFSWYCDDYCLAGN